jgi:chromosome segregation ATPase
MIAAPPLRILALAAMVALIGVGCGNDERDDRVRAQKEQEDRDKEEQEIRGNPDKLAAKAGKLEADITKHKNSLEYWEGKRNEADANANAAYKRGTSLTAHIDILQGGSQARDAADSTKHWIDERDRAQTNVDACKEKLDAARADMNKTRKWMAEAGAAEAAKAAAKNSAETSREMSRPPIAMPHVPMPAACGPRR